VFLHEVANPKISFKITAPNPSPELICDRRQLAQAISNVVKNGVEAIDQKPVPGDDSITITIENQNASHVTLIIADTGIGLPLERDRIVEPYMTTRPGGTGLGLAIVNKIMEDHRADISFADQPGGGTLVKMQFDLLAVISSANQGHSSVADTADAVVPKSLTRGRTH
jgi:two-component system nitrogen regulation sensor histidine kinase NtrY